MASHSIVRVVILPIVGLKRKTTKKKVERKSGKDSWRHIATAFLLEKSPYRFPLNIFLCRFAA